MPRRVVPRFVLSLAGAIAMLVALEAGLRLAGFRFRLFPETIEFGFPSPAEMASDFLPDRHLLWVKPDYAERVRAAMEQRPDLVLMGCSCTDWGRYDEVFERLQRERRDGHAMSYANLAVAGWSSYQGLQQMKSDVVAIRPRLVTIFYGWNDHWMGFGVDDRTAATMGDSLLFELSDLRIVQLLMKARLATVDADGASACDHSEGVCARPLRVAPEDFRHNLEEMVRIARLHGITPVLLTAPTSHRQGKEPPYLRRRWIRVLDDLVPLHRKYVQIVRDVAATQNVALCDLAAGVEDMPLEERIRMFRIDGIHFTSAGDEKVAELLYQCFETQHLFDRAP